MFFDSLEKRSLLSATLGADGVLTVTGTTGHDVIDIGLNRNGEIVVREVVRPGRPATPPTTPPTTPPAANARPVPTITKFAVADVLSIVVDAGDGNDAVHIGATAKRGETQLNATINGGAGHDILHAGAGNDLVNGGDGDDSIVGGPGADVLNGDAGNDLINAIDRGGVDTIDGGADRSATTGRGDVALVDAVDVVSNVEKILKRNKPTPPAPTTTA
jgi:Ca2+-binding RTX toxin-like protein